MSAPQSINTLRMCDLVTCSVCLEILRHPKVLQCLHSFCTHCLEKIVNPKQTSQLITIICPVCQVTTKVPAKGVQGFPNDFKAEQMKDLIVELNAEENGIRSTMEGRNAVCEVCQDVENGVPLLAEVHCSQCRVFYCSKCANKHNTNVLFQSHNLKRLAIKQTAKGTQSCSNHPGHDTQFLCSSCQHQEPMLCAICVLTHNGSHNIWDIKSAVTSHRLELSSKMNLIKSNIEVLRKRKESVNEWRSKLQCGLSNIGEAICLQSLLITAHIDETKERMLKALEEMAQSLTSTMQEDKLNMQVLKFVNLETNIDNVLQSSNETVLAEYKSIIDNFTNLQAMMNIDPLTYQHIEFIPNKNTIDENIIGTLTYAFESIHQGLMHNIDRSMPSDFKTERSETFRIESVNRNSITVKHTEGDQQVLRSNARIPNARKAINSRDLETLASVTFTPPTTSNACRKIRVVSTSQNVPQLHNTKGSSSIPTFAMNTLDTEDGLRKLKNEADNGLKYKVKLPSAADKSNSNSPRSTSKTRSRVNTRTNNHHAEAKLTETCTKGMRTSKSNNVEVERSGAITAAVSDGSKSKIPNLVNKSKGYKGMKENSSCTAASGIEPCNNSRKCDACSNRAAVISFYNTKKEQLEKLCRQCRALTDITHQD